MMPSMGSQRVGYNLVTEQQQTFIQCNSKQSYCIAWKTRCNILLINCSVKESGKEVIHVDTHTDTPGASQVAQWLKNLPAMQESQETWVQSLGEEGPQE